MSIFGKLLIVFNLLAAGAFAYFTLQDWKARQEITWNALSREVQLRGIAVEPQNPPPAADELGDKRVAFYFEMPGGLVYRSIPKDRLDSMIPKGDETYGDGPVADQTAEVARLQKKVIASIPAEGQPRFNGLQNYLLSLASTGAERDGVNALLDIRDKGRTRAARRDLPLVARTPSQVAALKAIVQVSDLGDPEAIIPESARTSRIALTREAVKSFLLGEVPHGAVGDEPRRTLTNKVLDALKDKAGDAEKKALADAAPADAAGWTQLANVAVEPLNNKPSCDRAVAGLLAFAQSKALVPTESAGLKDIADLISQSQQDPLPRGFDLDATVQSAALNLLNSKFDEAQLPSSSGKSGKGDPRDEKARKIAHLLFHIDAWRHADKTPAVVAERKKWHERVAAIIGLPAYIRAAEAEASEYADASQRLVGVITEEQSAFEAEYRSQVQRVLNLFAQWQVLDNQLKAQDAITKENDRLRAERQTEKANLEKSLEVAKADAKTALDKLKKTQARLFAIQKDLRDAQSAILALEKQLRQIELGTN